MATFRCLLLHAFSFSPRSLARSPARRPPPPAPARAPTDRRPARPSSAPFVTYWRSRETGERASERAPLSTTRLSSGGGQSICRAGAQPEIAPARDTPARPARARCKISGRLTRALNNARRARKIRARARPKRNCARSYLWPAPTQLRRRLASASQPASQPAPGAAFRPLVELNFSNCTQSAWQIE